MYEKLEQVSDLIKMAEEYVRKNDRMLYEPFMKVIEEFCASHDVLIGGIHILLGDPLTKDHFTAEIYASYALNVAREIGDLMYAARSPHIPARTTRVRTVVKNMEFEILVYERVVARVYTLYMGVDIKRFLGRTMRDGPFTGKKINCLPPEIYLCDLYRTLYSSSFADEWEKAADKIERIFAKLGNLAKRAEDVIKGGRGNKPHKVNWKDTLHAIEGEMVVVGDIAAKKLGLKNSGDRLQIISRSSPSDIAAQLKSIYGKTTFVVYPLNLPNDFQTKKYTFYNKERVAILDVYNSTEFELIPYTEVDGLFLGDNIVLLRFRMLEIWLQRAIMKPENINRNLLESLERSIMEIRRAEPRKDVKYVGTTIKRNVAKKLFAAEKSDFFYKDYYPALAEKNKANDKAAKVEEPDA